MKIIKYLLSFLLLFFTLIQLRAQSGKDNLNKYWLYRDRLRKYFVVVDPNDGFGTNIPFGWNSKTNSATQEALASGDGNDGLQYYIGMLATEYALMKKYGIDEAKMSQTRNELMYALKAVERLDNYAENNFRSASIPDNPTKDGSQPGDLNGYFVRDDIGKNFIDNWKATYPSLANFVKVSSCFTGGMEPKAFEESKDVIWNYIPNLALVSALVDDNEISQKVKEITYRMINYMHYEDYKTVTACCGWFDGCLIPHCWDESVDVKIWRIMNPITHKMTYGGDVEESGISAFNLDGFNYGFAESAHQITDLDLNFGNSNDGGRENSFYQHVMFPDLWASRYPHLALATVGGNNIEYQKQFFNNKNVTVMAALLDNVYNAHDGSRYEHLPLVRGLLDQKQINNGDNSNLDDIQYLNSITSLKTFYEDLLNEAPNCGPLNLGMTDATFYPRVDDWSMDNRLTNSSNLVKHIDPKNVNSILEKDNSWHFGIFNGIDYMLLHNLYWLYYVPFGDLYLTDADADNFKAIAKSQKDLGLQQVYTNLANQLLYKDQQGTEIISKRTIPSNNEITYTAAVNIELLPGFTAVAGSCFEASINGNWTYHYNDPTNIISSCNCYSIDPFITKKTTQTTLKSFEETNNNDQIQTVENNINNLNIVSVNSIEISPNPNQGSFIIKTNGIIGKYTVQIYNSVGYLLNNYNFDGGDQRIPITLLSSGVFIVKILYEGKTYSYKVISL